MKQQEVIPELVRKHKLTEEHAKLIEDEFWRAVRNIITDPMNSKGNILIPRTMSFEMNPYKLDVFIKKLNNKEIKKRYQDRNIEFYQELRDEIKKHERKKSNAIQHGGSLETIPTDRSEEGAD